MGSFLAWCLSSPLLIAPSLCLFSSFAPLPPSPCSLFTHNLSTPNVHFPPVCFYQSPNVIASLLRSFPTIPCDITDFLFCLTPILVLCQATASLLFRECATLTVTLPMWLSLDEHVWAWPLCFPLAGQLK